VRVDGIGGRDSRLLMTNGIYVYWSRRIADERLGLMGFMKVSGPFAPVCLILAIADGVTG
jgi:hypothetical protein